jgi:hypothetical protein
MTVLGATFYYLGVAVLACALFAWLNARMTKARVLRRLVWQNLDSAHEGRQFDNDGVHAGYLYGMGAAEVANDMSIYCEDLAGVYDEEELFPHVQAWMLDKGMAT